MLKHLLLLFAAVTGFGETAETAFEVQLTRHGSIEHVAVQADGRIFICGSFDFVAGEPRAGVARLNQDGSLDRTFLPQNQGRPIAITLDDAGVLVLENVPGSGAKLIRLDNQGRQTNGVSASFDWGISDNPAGSVQMRKRADGSILIFGPNFEIEGKSLFGMVKLNPDGSLDRSFSPAQTFGFSTVRAVVENGDGTFWVANQRLHQIDAEGRLLKTLNYFNVYNVVPLRNGKFLLGGHFPGIPLPASPGSDNTEATVHNLLRINPDGSEDTTYASPTNQLYQAAIHRLSDGRLLAMSYPPVILNADGELLRSINLPLGLNGYGPFAEQNGKFLIGDYGTAPRLEEANFGLARLNRIFSLDPTFSMPGGITRLNDGIESMAAFSDGSVIVAGGFDIVQGKSVPGIVKLTSSGEIDTNFTANLFAGTNSYTRELALEESGNLLIQGSDRSWNNPISTVERIDSAGLPLGRIIEVHPCDSIQAVHVLPQDLILVTTMVGGPCWINGIRTPDYRLFSSSGQFISNIVLQREILPPLPEVSAAESLRWGGTMNFVTPVSSDAFLIGGDFSHVNGLPRNGLAKVKISGEVDSAFQLSAAIPEPAAAVRLSAERFAVLCNRLWNGSADLIILNDTGTILGRFGLDGIDRIKAAHVRDGELVILSSSYLPNYQQGNLLSLCTVSLMGELLRKVDFGSIPTFWDSSDLEFQMIVEGSGSVLVAGAVSKPHAWSGVRRLSRTETSAFRLDVSSHRPDLHLKLRSPVGKTVRILKSHDLRNWAEVATVTATNSEPYEISHSSTIHPIFFRAETN